MENNEEQEERGSNQRGAQSNNYLSRKKISSSDVSEVKYNVHGRFYSASKKISIPIIAQAGSGEEYCHQFNFHHIDPLFRPVESVRWDDGKQILRANTPNGTAMVGLVDRSLPFDYRHQNSNYSGCIVPMSPERQQKGKKTIPVFKNNEGVKLDVKVKQENVLGTDVYVRTSSRKKRKPSQNRVMKCSAKDELKQYIADNSADLTAEAVNHLRAQNDAEWLHIVAYSLTNVRHNPQVRNNLGAARKQDNTRMMVIEKVPKRLSQYKDVQVDLQAQFSMLPNSEVVKDISYEVVIHHGRTRLNVYQNIDVFSEYDYPRNTDQLIALVIEALLQGQACHVSEVIAQPKCDQVNELMEVDQESKVADENEASLANDLRLFQPAQNKGGKQSGHNYNLRK
jgi:hypothetical protein